MNPKKKLPFAVKDEVPDVLNHIEAKFKSKSWITGLPTGFNDLDNKIGGFKQGHLIACFGRPCMGKTAFAISLMLNIARDKGPILYFALNYVSKEELISRFISALGQLDGHRVRTGFFDNSDRAKVVAGAGILSELPIYIDVYTRTIQEIERITKIYVKQKGVKLIVVDPLQHIDGYALLSKPERYKAYDMVCRRLRRLAVLCNIPIFLTVGLSRRFEENENNRRVHCFSQIFREEGNLEDHADVILSLYREEYYNPTDNNRGATDLCVIKGGPQGCIRLNFNRELGLIFRNS